MLKSIGRMMAKNKLETGLGLAFGFMDYSDAKKQGDSTPTALAKATLSGVLPMVMSTTGYIAYEAITSAPEIAVDAVNMYDQYSRSLKREARGMAFANAVFNDTEQVHTMRQASQAIAERSRYNTQHARLGGEAKYMYK